MAWMTGAQRLPGQKLDLVVDLPEGRGLVAREEVRKGDSLLEIPESTLITVARAVAGVTRLGPKHAELQEWSLLAAFLAEQALALEAGETTAASSPLVRARAASPVYRRRAGLGRGGRRSLLAGSPSLRAAREGQRAWRRRSRKSALRSRSSRPARCAGRSTCSSPAPDPPAHSRRRAGTRALGGHAQPQARVRGVHRRRRRRFVPAPGPAVPARASRCTRRTARAPS